MENRRKFESMAKLSKRSQIEQIQERDSSLSSLGSLPEVHSVASHFDNDNASRSRLQTHTDGSSSQHNNTSRVVESKKSDKRPRRMCPHCKKTFSNAWSVRKHIEVGVSSNEVLVHICTYCFWESQNWLFCYHIRSPRSRFMTEQESTIVINARSKIDRRPHSLAMTELSTEHAQRVKRSFSILTNISNFVQRENSKIKFWYIHNVLININNTGMWRWQLEMSNQGNGQLRALCLNSILPPTS